MIAFVPFGKYHAGKKRLRAFLIAPIVWSLMYAIVFAVIFSCSPTPQQQAVIDQHLTQEQQAKVRQAVVIACLVDGVIVPLAQPIVGTIGPGGAIAESVDALLVHPLVVQACKSGVPVVAVPKAP